MRRVLMGLALGLGCVELSQHTQAQTPKLDTVSKEQRAVVVKAIRAKVQSQFKDKWSDDQRLGIVEKARANPGSFVGAIKDPEKTKFGTLVDGRKFKVLKIVGEKEVLASAGDDAGPSSGFGPSSLRMFPYLLEVETKDLKVDQYYDFGIGKLQRADKTKAVVLDVYYVLGTKTDDKKKVWVPKKIEFTDEEKEQFDPRPKKK